MPGWFPAWAVWVTLGLLAMAAELLLPGAFLVWIGAAALATGLVLLFFDPGFIATALVFITLLVAGIGASLRLFRPRAAPATLNTPSSGLLGRTGLLLSAQGLEGRARIGDSDWPVRLTAEAEVGARVEVIAVQGMTLLVRLE